MYDENFYADLEKEEKRQEEEINTEEKYVGEYEDHRDRQEEQDADRLEEHFTREPY